MKRTTANDYKNWEQTPRYINRECCDYLNNVIQKLGKIEDLEEQLGCPLDIVILALKNGIKVMNDDNKKYQLSLYINTNKTWCFKNDYVKNVRLKDYGKNWRL